MFMHHSIRSTMAAVAIAFSGAATAGTIVDTGVPSGPAGYGIFDLGPTAFNSVAARFSLSASTRLTGIEGWLQRGFSGANNLVISVHADAAGVGNVLATEVIAVPTTGPDFGWAGGFSNGNLLLGPGNYWVSFAADPADPSGCNCWMPADNNVTIPFGAYRNNFTGGNWVQRDQYFGLRITGQTAVPEPASWALMIVGFGLIGAVSRRRKLWAVQRYNIN